MSQQELSAMAARSSEKFRIVCLLANARENHAILLLNCLYDEGGKGSTGWPDDRDVSE